MSDNILNKIDKIEASRLTMPKCPNCKKEQGEPNKTWKYGRFTVQAYSCDCGTDFREYTKAGKHSFTLKLKKGKGYIKA